MNKQSLGRTVENDDLRARAEELLEGTRPPTSAENLQATLHELQVHQVELELQNEAYRQSQNTLQEAHDRYMDLYELSPIGYATLGHDGGILEINSTATALFGLTHEELIDRPFETLLSPADAAEWRQFFHAQVLRGGRHQADFDLICRRNDTCRVHLDCLGVRRESVGLAVHVALTDITEVIRAQKALEESEARYRAIFENAGNGMVIADVQTRRFIDANAAFLRMLGINREQLVGLSVTDIHPAHALSRALDAFDRMAAGDITLVENIAVQNLDGKEINVDINGSPFPHGGFRRILGEFHDTSARRHAENALREQEAFFRLITENMDGFVAVLDIEGRRIYNSPSYARLLGDQSLTGSNSFADVHPDDGERVRIAFEQTVATGVGQRLDYRFVCADGSTRLIESRGGAILDEHGKTKRVVIVSNDITERKADEARIHQLAFYDALTQLPNRRTLNDRLQQALSASKRSGQYGALMFLDLDHFKPLNDTYGHSAGDQLLIQCAERLRDCVREIDTVARFGGDEFVVLLSELGDDRTASHETALRVAEKIRESLARPFLIPVRRASGEACYIEHQCTASLGVTLFHKQNENEEDLLKHADVAMYRAKEAGRNCIRFHV